MDTLPPHAPEVLLKAAGLLDSLGVKWWIGAGTLLGIYRDGRLIPHDNDLDISVEAAEISEELRQVFDFPTVRVRDYQHAVTMDGVCFDIMLWRPEGNELVCRTDDGEMRMPADVFELGTIEFEGIAYPCPDPERYLPLRYGPDWKTPMTERGDWTEYTACLSRPT